MSLQRAFHWYCLPGRLLAKWTYLFPKSHLQAIRSARHLDSKLYHFMGSSVLYIVLLSMALGSGGGPKHSRAGSQPTEPSTLARSENIKEPARSLAEPAPDKLDLLTACTGSWIYSPPDWNSGIGVGVRINEDGSFAASYSDFGRSEGQITRPSSQFLKLGDDGQLGNCTANSANLVHSNGTIYDMRRSSGDPETEWRSSGWIAGE